MGTIVRMNRHLFKRTGTRAGILLAARLTAHNLFHPVGLTAGRIRWTDGTGGDLRLSAGFVFSRDPADSHPRGKMRGGAAPLGHAHADAKGGDGRLPADVQ
jgi:hypothetical protein